MVVVVRQQKARGRGQRLTGEGGGRGRRNLRQWASPVPVKSGGLAGTANGREEDREGGGCRRDQLLLLMVVLL